MIVPAPGIEPYRLAERAALLGLVVNVALAAVKLAGGLAGDAFPLLADAVNSAGDALTSLVVVLALRLARKPPDAEHPYGHTRAESVAAANVALLIAVSAVALAWEAVRRLPLEQVTPAAWTLAIALANVIVKESLYRYKRRVGEQTGSAALVANAWDHRGDALASLAVLVGLAAVRWGGPAWHAADELAALFVAGGILWGAVRLFRVGASDLLDRQAEPEVVAAVARSARNVVGIADLETLRVRKSGLEYFVDVHVEVDPRMTVAAGHALGHDVKARILAEVPRVRDVLVHVEPHGGAAPRA